MYPQEIADALKGTASAKVSDVLHVVTFKAVREDKNGATQGVELKVYDAGPAAGSVRYSCEITSDDGKRATGNAADTLEHMFAGVHWFDLDPQKKVNSFGKVYEE